MIKLHKDLTPVRIAITGGLRSGKSTLATAIRDSLDGSRVFSFGDGLKYYFHEIFLNENGAKDRDGLVKFGQSCVDIDKYVWVKHLAEIIDGEVFCGWDFRGVIIDDLRQPHEYDFLRDNGFEIVRIEADAYARSERAKNEGDNFTSDSLNHPIEKYHETFDVDFTLNGNASPEEVFSEFMSKTKFRGEITAPVDRGYCEICGASTFADENVIILNGKRVCDACMEILNDKEEDAEVRRDIITGIWEGLL